MEYNVRRGSSRYSRRNINGLKPQMGVAEIDFDTIYVNAIPLSEDIQIFGYVRAWKNGKVGYSVLEEATERPDLSNCGVFWMRPEDFVKVFKVFGERADNIDDPETASSDDAKYGSCDGAKYGSCDGAEYGSCNGAKYGSCDDDNVMETKCGNGVKAGKGNRNIMDNITEFRERFKDAVMKVLPEKMRSGLELRDMEVVKINDQKLYGIAFDRKGVSPSPTFYINDYYENYIHGARMDGMVKLLVDMYMFSYKKMDPGMEKAFMKNYEEDFDELRNRLTVKVLAKERNREFLKKMPHKDIDFGFSMVFDVQNVIRGNDVWRMPVTESIIENAGVSEDELYEIAMEKVNEVDPAVLMSVERAASGKKVKNLLENDKRVSRRGAMYVLTNRCGKYGAAALFYPGMQKRIADKLQDSYFAIPSSLHEFIIVPESSGADMVQLRKTLWYDNSANENQEDVFCNEILHYDRKYGELACVTDMIGSGGAEC